MFVYILGYIKSGLGLNADGICDVIGIWRDRSDAQRGGAGHWHRRARGAAREMYERIEFGMLRLVVGRGGGDDGDGMDWGFSNWEE